jgi:hypothetical protein
MLHGAVFSKRAPLAAGGIRQNNLWPVPFPLHPIHGRGVFQRSNIISNLIGCMRRMLVDGIIFEGFLEIPAEFL